MADQNIQFRDGNDTGQRNDPEAIQPYSDGEAAKEAVLNRSPENLRHRTEVLRAVGENSKFLHDADKGWRIVGGNTLGAGASMPSVTWDPDGYAPGEGTFVISNPIMVQPMNTPAVDSKETKVYGLPPLAGPPYAATVEFTAELFSYEGMNYRRIIWEAKDSSEIPNGRCLVTVTGNTALTDLNTITITVRDDFLVNPTQLADIEAELIANTGDITAAGFSWSVSGPAATDVDALPVDPDYTMRSTWERQLHHIEPGDVSSFFGTRGLADGDTVGIYYNWLVEDGGDGGRRQSTPTSGATPPNTEAGTRLFVTTEEPWKIPLSIPLCKRVGNYLLFIDGTILDSPQNGTVHFGQNGLTINALVAAATSVNVDWSPSTWHNAAPTSLTPPQTLQNTIKMIIDDLARNTTSGSTPSGGFLVGIEPQVIPSGNSQETWSMSSPWAVGNAIVNLGTFVGNKAALAQDESITGVWRFDVGAHSVRGDHTTVRDTNNLPAPGVAFGIYTNNLPPYPHSPTLADFVWGMITEYEVIDTSAPAPTAAPYSRILCVGCIINSIDLSGDIEVLAAPGDPGNPGHIAVFAEGVANGVWMKTNALGGATYHTITPPDFANYDYMGITGLRKTGGVFEHNSQHTYYGSVILEAVSQLKNRLRVHSGGYVELETGTYLYFNDGKWRGVAQQYDQDSWLQSVTAGGGNDRYVPILKGNSGGDGPKIYIDQDNNLVIAHNCYWDDDSTLWRSESASYDATVFKVVENGIQIWRKSKDDSPFIAWEEPPEQVIGSVTGWTSQHLHPGGTAAGSSSNNSHVSGESTGRVYEEVHYDVQSVMWLLPGEQVNQPPATPNCVMYGSANWREVLPDADMGDVTIVSDDDSNLSAMVLQSVDKWGCTFAYENSVTTPVGPGTFKFYSIGRIVLEV
jgi:hypothetical protein